MGEIIRCRDCVHFQEDFWVNMGGIPIIAAHNICEKWGNGCATQPERYCHMATRKEETEHGSKE